MKNSQFDAYGESGAKTLKEVAGGSRLVERAGVGLFWGLVVVIVATRAAYFDQGLEDQLRFAAGVARSVLSALT